MKNLVVLLFLILPFRSFAQSDTSTVFTFTFDTTWNHSIMESDLILFVEVTDMVYITGAGSFSGNVLQVVKGEYGDHTFSVNVALMDFSRERLEKRTAGICPSFDAKLPYTCYIGLNKVNYNYRDLRDKVTKQSYEFFMSQKNMKKELKAYLQKFVIKKLIPFYLGI